MMNFGNALDLLKLGHKVGRQGWNGKDQYVILGTNFSFIDNEGNVVNANHTNIGGKALVFVGTSGIQVGWLASQADMLADDWVSRDYVDTVSPQLH